MLTNLLGVWEMKHVDVAGNVGPRSFEGGGGRKFSVSIKDTCIQFHNSAHNVHFKATQNTVSQLH